MSREAFLGDHLSCITNEMYHIVCVISNNNGRNGSFLRGWLPHRGKAQMACNYRFPTRTMF